jgi:hypothetical protein
MINNNRVVTGLRQSFIGSYSFDLSEQRKWYRKTDKRFITWINFERNLNKYTRHKKTSENIFR